MSIFDRDKVNLLKTDGTKVDGIAATVSGSNLIVIKGEKVIISSGDILVRPLSNGGEETYEVVDPRYYDVGHIGPHYQLQVKKLGIPEAKAAVQHITYNLSGVNSRVNVNSTDNSTNVININSEVAQEIGTLREAISAAPLSEAEKKDASEVVEAVEAQFQTGKPKRSIVSALLSSLPKVLEVGASVATILAACG
ncbi:hypothetical protein VV867_08910 [Pseudomonas sp. JH-2]|uniref:hypothetical protein n=1 Tax=Pseudomonas sp. JH-2 TaxID=3114998 RepID=UPI002E25576C|nr:hypothetical protein [Pseudomonas sp. JH-2]